MTGVFDPGLQLERTLLAWRRTCLAFGAASAVAVRFTVEVAGPVAVLLGAVGVGLAVAAYLAAARRYRRGHRSLTEDGSLPTGGAPLALAGACAIVLGAACAVFVLLQGELA